MYAIAFDLKIAELKKNYGEPYNGTYQEINEELKKAGFEWTQESVYLSMKDGDNLTAVYKAINALSSPFFLRMNRMSRS